MTLIIPKPASFPTPTWVEDQIAFVAPDGTILPTRLLVQLLGPRALVTDDPRNKRTLLDLTRLLGTPQETATIGDTSPHIVGTGIDIAADALTTLDAEVYAKDDSGNWAWWRITRGVRRVGTGAAAFTSATKTPTGFPDGSNSGAPPSGWAATFALGSGANANTAYVQLTGPASFYFYLDGSRYPGDELALLPTVSAVYPAAGETTGGTPDPTITSVSPAGGPTSGGP